MVRSSDVEYDKIEPERVAVADNLKAGGMGSSPSDPAGRSSVLSGSARFHQILKELGTLHDAKQHDYGRDGDPFSNVRASEDFGIPAWVGAVVRANDKMRRIQKAACGGKLKNESLEDSLKDLAVYSIIALVLWEEGKQ